jgi:hypothetical protein
MKHEYEGNIGIDNDGQFRHLKKQLQNLLIQTYMDIFMWNQKVPNKSNL